MNRGTKVFRIFADDIVMYQELHCPTIQYQSATGTNFSDLAVSLGIKPITLQLKARVLMIRPKARGLQCEHQVYSTEHAYIL